MLWARRRGARRDARGAMRGAPLIPQDPAHSWPSVTSPAGYGAVTCGAVIQTVDLVTYKNACVLSKAADGKALQRH